MTINNLSARLSLIFRAVCLVVAALFFCGCAVCGTEKSASTSIEPQAGIDAVLTELPSAVPTATPSPSPEATPVPADTPTSEPTPAPTATPTAEPTPAPTATPKPPVVPTATPAPTPTPTPATTDTPTVAPTATPKPTVAPTATPKPTETPGVPVDFGIFDDFCFIGNSLLHGVHAYNAITNGKWMTKESLNVKSVYTVVAAGCTKPIMQELESGSYRGIVLHFGLNEVGWPNLDTVANLYEKALKDIHTRQPNAKLFVLGMLPVTKKQSANTSNNITNERIKHLNSLIIEFVGKLSYAYYIAPPPELIGSDGALLDSASGGDGMHLTGSATRTWAKQICREVTKLLN
ncbi:MAG: hypothetical protein IKS90_01480 [Clostridia bacterium]|nr:hypothetical protein [Clostridia bacterium]